MIRWIAIAAGALIAFAVVSSLPELERYRQIRGK
jgi:hypothetical protein